MSKVIDVLTPTRDAQAQRPSTQLSLTRVGVSGVEKVLRVKINGTEQLYYAELECFVDLNPQQAGVHMSRFEQEVGEAIDQVVLGEAFRAETLAVHIAERIRESQGGMRAEVRVAARYPEIVVTPESGAQTQEIYTLFGTAVASERGTRTLRGVQAQGMTACPCAQELVAELSRERLAERGFDVDELGDLRAAEARRRAIGGGQGPLATALRRGLHARDGSPRDRGLPGNARR